MQSVKQVVFVDADKYVVARPYHDTAPFAPSETITAPYGTLHSNGDYEIREGFLFSANFPAINTFNTRRAACVHDFFYCLIKDGYLPRSFRADADYLLYDMLREDGMPDFRAWYWYKAVHIGGDRALDQPRPRMQYSPAPYQSQPAVTLGRAPATI
jgi:hypothetical protein